jgi:hypothetical protein
VRNIALDAVLAAVIEGGEDFGEAVERLEAQAVVDPFEQTWADVRRETR